MKNYCARHNCVDQGIGMRGLEMAGSYVNSTSSFFRAAFCHCSRRFSVKVIRDE
jgi:hypothetical protein